MHTTSDARTALVLLFGCIGVAAVAHQSELRWARRPALPVAHASPGPQVTSAEAARLREGQPLDLNRASAEDLALLPGVGPKLAREIVRVRAQQGGFASLDALDGVRGIGARKLDKLRPWLIVR